MNTYIKDRREEGFTLIELLIAIVVVGILTAVVIVGIGGLTNDGKAPHGVQFIQYTGMDASKAATAVHYSNQTPNAYPTDLKQMVDANELDKPTGVTYGAGNLSFNNGWHMTMTVTAGAPTFACT